jgi:excisionase family DNA binding protein
VHISTIRRWIRQGKLPAYRVGDKGIRVRYGDVMQLLTPVGNGHEDGQRADNRLPQPSHLTDEEQHRAHEAVETARALQHELRAEYGTMTPESWEFLKESREERTADPAHAGE